MNIAEHEGVVHSFDGSLEEADMILKKGLYIGINGCSLKTQEGIDVVNFIPLEKILIETDSPFCLIRKSYAAADYTRVLKSKSNSPENVIQIAEVIAKVKNTSVHEVERITAENTLKVFPKLVKFIDFWK